MCQRGTSHHPNDELSIVGDGRVSSAAIDRFDGDVRGELDWSSIGLSFATKVVGDAQSGFALLRMRESGRQGTRGEPVRYRLPGRGSEKRGLWKYPRWSPGPVDHTDVPRMEAGLESAPRWGCIEVGNLV